MSNMHARVMRLQHGPAANREHWLDYAEGHLHARQAAAEIAAEGDALIAELVEALERTLSWLSSYPGGVPLGESGPYAQARGVLAKARGEQVE